MIFLIRPPPNAPTRARNHTDKALSGCQRNQVQASSTIAARTRLLPSFPIPCSRSLPPAGERRPAKADVSGERASIAKLPHERLTDEKRSGVRTDGPQGRQGTDHPFRFIRRRVLLQNSVARRLHLIDQLQDEFKSIEQTFDTRFRLLRDGIAVRLARTVQSLAAIPPQSLVALDAERRQNAVDLVDDRSSLPGQIFALAIGAPRLLLGLARDRNHRTDAGFASQPGHQGAQQHLDIDLVGLGSSRPPSTGRLEGCMTCTSIPCRARKRASQKPSRPAS